MRTRLCLVIVLLLIWLAGSRSSFAADEPPPPPFDPRGSQWLPVGKAPIDPTMTENYLVYHPDGPDAGPDVYTPLPPISSEIPEAQNTVPGLPPAEAAPVIDFPISGEPVPMAPDAGPLAGILPAAVSPLPAQPAGFIPMSEIAYPENYPHSMSAMVFTHWPSGSGSYCSGALINEKVLLTAGHCVYTWNPANCTGGATKCWASTLDVYPGYKGGVYYPEGANRYGIAYSTGKHTFSQWTDNQNWDYDLAWVTLDRLVGALTGAFGYGSNTDTFFWNTTFYNPGYPNVAPYNNGGLTQWTREGSLDDVTTEQVAVETSPLYYGREGAEIFDSTYTVYGLESHYHVAGSTDLVRITGGKWTTLNNSINGLIPTTYDLAVLDVVVSPTSIPAGSTLTALNMLITNYSTQAFSGSVTANTYLSTNATISSSDLLLDSRSLPLTLGARNGIRANFTGLPTIPQSTAGGTYYIGSILNISDANSGNNTTTLWDEAQVTINQCNKPGNAGLTSPAVDSFTADTTPYLDWTSTSDTSRYLLWVDNNGDWSSREVDSYATSSNYTTGTLAQGKYYWAVRAHNQVSGCSVWGDWSDVFSFTIDTTAPNSIVDLIPTPTCPTSFRVSWSGYDPAPSSGGLRYNVQYRVNGGAWINWLTDEIDTEAWFGNGSPVTLALNARYDFRSQVKDAVGNIEPYPTMPDSGVTIGRCIYLPFTKK